MTIELPARLAALLEHAAAGLGWDVHDLVLAALAQYLALPEAVSRTDPVRVVAGLVQAGLIRFHVDPPGLRVSSRRRASPRLAQFVCQDCGEPFERAATFAKRCHPCRLAARKAVCDARNAKSKAERQAGRAALGRKSHPEIGHHSGHQTLPRGATRRHESPRLATSRTGT